MICPMAILWYKDKLRAESKYKNVKTVVDGISFDSKKEANYYCKLKILKKGKVIKDFKRQVTYELQPGFKYKGTYFRPIKYVADFVVTYADGHTEVIDVKGMETDVYLLKRKMLLHKYPDIDFREV